RILNKPMNMQLLGDAQPQPARRERPAGAGGERRGNGAPRPFNGDRPAGAGGERRGNGAPRSFSGDRREGSSAAGERRPPSRAPRRTTDA
ncbi:MAG: ATP-dependent RNA helicase, partial [Serratia sp.]|nr:ATP-dependent RNA helicase [Serratia sp. (in: enterobacteria)]